MADILPFAAMRYARQLDLSKLIAPPYDVLDDVGKAELQGRHPNNIVTVDLPHLPAKTVGPDDTYAHAAVTLQAWISAGILQRDPRPAFYPYSQTYQHLGRSFHRRGFMAAVKLSRFGEGHVVPHEKTYPEAIADRLKLTRATQMQLSPIFGLFSDPGGQITNLLYHNLGLPESTANLQNVRNDLWRLTDSSVETDIILKMGANPIYIADGHHRYTMALQYQLEQQEAHGGQLPPHHPANYCMFVLVAMQEDGLQILPTHRLIGGLRNFSPAALADAAPDIDLKETTTTVEQLPAFIDSTLPKQPPHTFGLFDAQTKKTYLLTLKNPEILKTLEPDRSEAWRHLDVAILQRYLIDEVLKPKFAGGQDPPRGYSADSSAMATQVDRGKYQIALLLKSTPLHALEDLGRSHEVMPPKSTYFFPKLATGMALYPVT